MTVWMAILFTYLAIRSYHSLRTCADRTRREEVALTMISSEDYIAAHFKKHRWAAWLTLLSLTAILPYAYQAFVPIMQDELLIGWLRPQTTKSLSNFFVVTYMYFDYSMGIKLAVVGVAAMVIVLLTQFHRAFLWSALLRQIHPQQTTHTLMREILLWCVLFQPLAIILTLGFALATAALIELTLYVGWDSQWPLGAPTVMIMLLALLFINLMLFRTNRKIWRELNRLFFVIDSDAEGFAPRKHRWRERLAMLFKFQPALNFRDCMEQYLITLAIIIMSAVIVLSRVAQHPGVLFSIQSNNRERFTQLLEAGIDPMLYQSLTLRNPLFCAKCYHGSYEWQLVNSGAAQQTLEAVEPSQLTRCWTIIVSARGNQHTIKSIFQQNFDPTKLPPQTIPGIILYAPNDKVMEWVKARMAMGDDVNQLSAIFERYSAIYAAIVRYHDPESIGEFLLQHGVDLNYPYSRGWDSPIMCAAYQGRKKWLAWLLDHGAQVNPSQPWQTPPIFNALSIDDLDVLRLMIEHGADVNVRFDSLRYPKVILCPLLYAIELGKIGAMRILLEHGAKLDDAEDMIRPPLHHAAASAFSLSHFRIPRVSSAKPIDYAQRKELFRLLIEHGAEINLRDHHGLRPLHYAIKGIEPEHVQALLELGADPDPALEDGELPMLEFARREGDPQITEMIRAAQQSSEDATTPTAAQDQ
ncbi:hypothetical protein JXA32_15490 [Candidatus Sumerlaeota bacterium]|nr:hypothetical protein [Candidatus Sumerlaeota bacterium]